MKKRKKLATGTGNRGVVNSYLSTPAEILAKNDINLRKAQYEGASNPFVLSTQVLGQLGMQYGMNNGGMDQLAGFAQGQREFGLGGTVDSKGKGKGKKLDEKDKESINASTGLDFSQNAINSLFERVPGANPGQAPQLDFGKYADQGYFDIANVSGDSIVISNTQKNPHNAATIKQNMDYIRKLNPNKSIELKYMAYGGTVGTKPVNIEGGEVVTDPYGNSVEAKGPSHANGGINLDLLEGSHVFSKQISRDGATMAEREKKRQSKVNSIEKKFDGYEDPALKNAFKRTEYTTNVEKEQDLSIQDLVKNAVELLGAKQPTSERETAAYGLNGNDPLADLLKLGSSSEGLHDPMFQHGTITSGNVPSAPTNVNMEMSDVGGFGVQSFDEGNDSLGMSGGDILGLMGNAYSSIAPMLNTMNSRATDTPNVNNYAGFGEDALEANDKAKGYSEDTFNELLKSMNSRRIGAKRSGRIGARGINTQRAMDLSQDQAFNQQEGAAYADLSKVMAGIYGNQSQLENIQDGTVMQGADQADIRNRDDKDNYYSNMAENIVGLGEGMQQTGKDLNQVKQNEMIMTLLNQLSKYGIKLDKNMKLKTD